MSEVGTFWARRRAAVEVEAEADARADELRQEQLRAEALAEKDDADVLAELDLPDPANMKAGDDFSAFMARDVPEHLRRQALRTLWRSNPVLACVDGLNEYDDDYRAAMLLQEPIKTAYQVGKGMLKHIEEMERQANPENPENEDPVADDAEVLVAESEECDGAKDDIEVTQAATAAATQSEPTEGEELMAGPRRMRFRFEEAAV